MHNIITARTLIAVVCGIFVLTGISYLTIAPRMNERLSMQGNSPVISDDIDMVSNTQSAVATQDTLEVTSTPSEVVIASVPQPIPSPAPTSKPTPIPTPKPAPVPAPAPSGITLAQVSAHGNATSCWSSINGNVYDLTSFINKHPGGASRILSICGKDGSKAFDNQHAGEPRPEKMLAAFLIGALSS